jgi:hypothetical protein
MSNLLSEYLPGQVRKFDSWVDGRLIRILDHGAGPPEPLRGLVLADVLVILLFIVLSLALQLDRLGNGYPTVILAGDTGHIASFAAARRYPELFAGDEVLGTPETFRIYSTIHIPLVIGLQALLGNFGLAFSLLLGLHAFLHYLGYYWLGRHLFRHRSWALVLSLVSGGFIDTGLQDGWGLFPDTYPRFTFQVIVPFILLLIFRWQAQPGRWPWIMAIAGLLTFVHPVSTPAWAAAFWLGFLPFLPDGWSLRKKGLQLAWLGMVLLAALLPFTFIYLSSRGQGGSPAYDLAYSAIDRYFGEGALHISVVARSFYLAAARHGLLWLSMAGLLTMLAVFRSERNRILQILMWAGGITIVSLVIPGLEQIIERHFRIIPLQTELPRGMRYLILIMLIFCVYPLAELTHRLRSRAAVFAVFALGTLLGAGWLYFQPAYSITALPRVADCLRQGRAICPRQQDYASALAAIRAQTPANAKFVTFWRSARIEKGIEVRYLALRPLVYAYKDIGLLAISNSSGLARWTELETERHKIVNMDSLETRLGRIIKWGRDAGADYLLTDYSYSLDDQGRLGISVIHQNGGYFIIKLHP